MDARQFGARLKELREQGQLTQAQLAEKAGLSQRAVSHWEQGLREPSWSNVLALGQALGVDCLAFQQVAQIVTAPRRGRPSHATRDTAGKAKATPTKRSRRNT